MEAVTNAVSAHVRISKTLLRAADLAALDDGTSRSQVINKALGAFFKASGMLKNAGVKKTTTKKIQKKATTKGRQVTNY